MTAGEAFRKAVLDEFEIEGVAAESMLDQLCAVVEEIAALQAAIDEHGVIIPGARGQLIESPALRALSRSRTTFARLLAQAFPETETKRTKLARAAAQARWRGTPREAR